MNVFVKNWKTTLTGLIAGLVVVLTAIRQYLSGEPVDGDVVIEAIVGISVILMGLFARDADKSSKQTGVKDK